MTPRRTFTRSRCGPPLSREQQLRLPCFAYVLLCFLYFTAVISLGRGLVTTDNGHWVCWVCWVCCQRLVVHRVRTASAIYAISMLTVYSYSYGHGIFLFSFFLLFFTCFFCLLSFFSLGIQLFCRVAVVSSTRVLQRDCVALSTLLAVFHLCTVSVSWLCDHRSRTLGVCGVCCRQVERTLSCDEHIYCLALRALVAHLKKKTSKHVSGEFDKFRIDTHLCKLRDTPALMHLVFIAYVVVAVVVVVVVVVVGGHSAYFWWSGLSVLLSCFVLALTLHLIGWQVTKIKYFMFRLRARHFTYLLGACCEFYTLKLIYTGRTAALILR